MVNNKYYGQFFISQNKGEAPYGWVENFLLNWNVYTHPALPISKIVNPLGDLIGFVIGYFIDKQGNYTPAEVLFEADKIGIDKWIENEIYSLSGRYACILKVNEIYRVYLDPAGSMPVVFDKAKKTIASSSGLLSNELDKALLAKIGMPQSGLYIPYGLTAHSNVSRLLPNHFLDLLSFCIKRHWPVKELEEISVDDAIEIVSERLKYIINSVAKSKDICIPLTGGRDSRMLLAASREIVSDVEFITVASSRVSMDSHLANILTSSNNLMHRTIIKVPASQSERNEWLENVGRCVSGAACEDHKSYSQFEYDRVLMPGICGEIGRGFFYIKYDAYNNKLTPSDLLKRMKIPSENRLLNNAAKYLAELEAMGFDKYRKLDFVYHEQRLGSWASPTELGGDKYSVGKLWPMCDRVIISCFHSIPLKRKFDDDLARGIIRKLWPRMDEYQYNKYTGNKSFAKNAYLFMVKASKYISSRVNARLR